MVWAEQASSAMTVRHGDDRKLWNCEIDDGHEVASNTGLARRERSYKCTRNPAVLFLPSLQLLLFIRVSASQGNLDHRLVARSCLSVVEVAAEAAVVSHSQVGVVEHSGHLSITSTTWVLTI